MPVYLVQDLLERDSSGLPARGRNHHIDMRFRPGDGWREPSAVVRYGSAEVTEGETELLPTVTGFAARQAIAALRKHNIATAPLLRRAGLSEYDFARGDSSPLRHRISAVGQAKFRPPDLRRV